jgi:hypothetical protein
MVDPSALLAPVFEANYGGLAKPLADPRTAVEHIAPRRADGTSLASSPYEVAFLPQDVRPGLGTRNLCPASGGTPSVPWRAMVTFPSCDLVALVDFPSGNIVESLRVVMGPGGRPDLRPAGSSPSCPVDCGEPADSPDGGGDPDAGAPNTASNAGEFAPSGIAIAPDGRSAYISLARNRSVIAIDLAGGAAHAWRSLELVGAPEGSTRLRLGVDPYQFFVAEATAGTTDPPLFQGKFVGDRLGRKYLYVIARDGSLRVIDLLRWKECETNVDPRNLPPGTTPTTGCFEAETSAAHRRPFEGGPGLRFPSLPIDVAAADIRPSDDPATAANEQSSEATVAGGHAWVLTSSGAVFLVNIDPVLRGLTPVVYNATTGKAVKVETAIPEPSPFANSKRDRNAISYSTSLDPSSGPARVTVAPPLSFTGPYIESFWTKGTAANAVAQGDDFLATPVYFPDPSAAVPQAWTVSWQGALINGRHAGRISDDGKRLEDQAGYCGQGVLPGDTVTFNGCIADSGCIPGFKCHRDSTVTEVPGGLDVTGLCVDPAQETRFAEGAPEVFQTIRRYEITVAKSSELTLVPHLDEIVYSSLSPNNPCNGSAAVTPDGGGADGGGADGGVPDAGDSADGGALDASAPDPVDGSADAGEAGAGGPISCANDDDPSTMNFECVASPGWTGPAPAPMRCLRPCTTNLDCRRGRICLPRGGGRFCADAPELNELAPILGQVVTYTVNAGASFVVTGAATGSLSSGREEGGMCVPDNRDARLIARIPVRPAYGPDGLPVLEVRKCPFMDNTFDNRSPADVQAACLPGDGGAVAPNCWQERFPLDKIALPTLQNNPCVYIGGPAGAEDKPHVRALFQNTQVSFAIANVDREPPVAIDMRFDVSGGFRAQSAAYPSTVEVSTPARIVVGPVDSQPQNANSAFEAPYLFVVDQRRIGRSAQAGGATRGQLVRIHPLAGGFTVGTAKGFQPTYEDYSRSGNLFPIQ